MRFQPIIFSLHTVCFKFASGIPGPHCVCTAFTSHPSRPRRTRPTTRPCSAAASSRTTWRWRRRSSWCGTWTRQVCTGFAPGLTKLGQVWSVRVTQTGQFRFALNFYQVHAMFRWFVPSSCLVCRSTQGFSGEIPVLIKVQTWCKH